MLLFRWLVCCLWYPTVGFCWTSLGFQSNFALQVWGLAEASGLFSWGVAYKECQHKRGEGHALGIRPRHNNWLCNTLPTVQQWRCGLARDMVPMPFQPCLCLDACADSAWCARREGRSWWSGNVQGQTTFKGRNDWTTQISEAIHVKRRDKNGIFPLHVMLLFFTLKTRYDETFFKESFNITNKFAEPNGTPGKFAIEFTLHYPGKMNSFQGKFTPHISLYLKDVSCDSSYIAQNTHVAIACHLRSICTKSTTSCIIIVASINCKMR